MHEKRKALFVDRDGTLNYDAGYTHKLSDLKIYDDIIPVLKDFYDKNYLIIVLTNQSGIGRGYYTVEEMQSFNQELAKMLMKYGIKIEDFFYCPHLPDQGCKCRKPETGMIEEAAKKYNIDIKNSVVIGDSEKADGKMAEKLGIKFIKVHGYD
ncbi:HAD family hydrolase [Ferroplasma sp.]|uniref:D-glycero-alpha-D-manno-heptose-1,7-bisphosphate 7-phosphatase n=1 Tax=Ferroplasma sp. TaxID=2591003 RepID=UPI00307D799F